MKRQLSLDDFIVDTASGRNLVRVDKKLSATIARSEDLPITADVTGRITYTKRNEDDACNECYQDVFSPHPRSRDPNRFKIVKVMHEHEISKTRPYTRFEGIVVILACRSPNCIVRLRHTIPDTNSLNIIKVNGDLLADEYRESIQFCCEANKQM
jgi:hypothetical protein